MDFLSGLQWIKMNDILNENFKWITLNEKDQSRCFFLLPVCQAIFSMISSGRMFLSGSAAEFTTMSPGIQYGKMEVDVMATPSNFVVSRDKQEQMFDYNPDEPAYVRLEIDALTTRKKEFHVKEVKHCNGESRFYLIPDPKMWFPEIKGFPKSRLTSKNFVIQSVFDILDLSCLEIKTWLQGPAYTAAFDGFFPPANLMKQSKNTLINFFENLGKSCMGHLENQSITELLQTVQDIYAGIDIQKAPCLGIDSCTEIDVTKAPYPLDDLKQLGIMMDIVPAIECEGWPEIASGFFSRTRVWPSTSTLNSLREQGFHLVYKPLYLQSPDSVEWRISFSTAEMTLFHSMDGFRIYCYRVFKTIYYCELTLPNVLCSYHMKTIFLWACERIPPEFWVEKNLAQIIMGLLDDLLHCLVTKTCPHFFIPENNLFAHLHGDFLDHVAKVVSKIRKNPERYPLTKSYLNCSQNQADKTAHNEITKKQDIPLD